MQYSAPVDSIARSLSASIAVETMTRELLSATEVLSRLDPAILAREIAEQMRLASEEITRDVLTVRDRPKLATHRDLIVR